MPTKIVDASLHGSTIPTTYTGPGQLAGNCVQSAGAMCDVYGNFTSDGNVVQINCGFTPRLVEITDVTGVLVWRWTYGMPATNSVKTATGAVTIDTGSMITVAPGTVTLSATVVGSAKNICFHIQG